MIESEDKKRDTVKSQIVKEQRETNDTKATICYGSINQQTGQKSSDIIKLNVIM